MFSCNGYSAYLAIGDIILVLVQQQALEPINVHLGIQQYYRESPWAARPRAPAIWWRSFIGSEKYATQYLAT